MLKKTKIWAIIAIILLLTSYLFFTLDGASYLRYLLYNKNELNLSLSIVNQGVKALAADPSNRLPIKVRVRDENGLPMPKAHIVFSTPLGMGEIYPTTLSTDKYGEGIATYTPPLCTLGQFKDGDISVTLTAGIHKAEAKASVSLSLVRTPIILVHGYQENKDIFTNLKEFLKSRGFEAIAFDYNSADGIIQSAKALSSFLDQQAKQYYSQGTQVKMFDILAHSMGGLVTRYYTCGKEYILKENVRKIIFLSVPQKGSHMATIGTSYFKDQGIQDLIPDSAIFTKAFPSMLNKGLNQSIQVGSIMGEFDEVVSPESASLDEWGIKNEVFNVGESNFTVDSLLNGNFMDAPNHKNILNNNKVFEKIEEMLGGTLPYPTIQK